VFGRGIRIPDLDRLFCYDTPKLLRVIDFKPGLVYRAGIVFVCLYCFGFALVVNQMFLEYTDAVGTALVSMATPPDSKVIQTTVKPLDGGATAAGAWDLYDIVYPPTEVGGIFITTRSVETTGQVMKECANKESKFPACPKKLPIYPGLKYPGTEHCMEYTWCPKFGQGGEASTDEVLDGKGLGELELEFNLFLNWFPHSTPETYIAQTKKATVKDILKQAGIKDISTITETGCIIYATFNFGTASKACGTGDANCEPVMKVMRIDEEPSVGFKYRRTHYYRGNSTTSAKAKEMRDMARTFGIRIIATAVGHGETFSITACTLQVASALSMWQLVYFVADIFTVWLNLRMMEYTAFKYAKTPDFGDLKEAEEAKKIDAQANKKTKRPRRNRARLLGGGEEEEEEP